MSLAKSAWFQPLFQHHQNPDHGSIVARVALQVDRDELVDEIRPHDSPLLQVREAIERYLPQRAVRLYPGSERKPEAMLCLANNLLGQKAMQRLFEKIAQPATPQLQIRRQAGGECN